ncbi:maleylpyruvate isomerase family mycothiol-dependent enzyme [Umezawaea sp. Da 62-37]|uniref:maleylpyruvate isomerase family mycothiol-dependent enzyme n=1 Tax=Umezawaea sp. Da 62-37 TaxID=3075927 RepID=UPI0028F6E7F1|nr:maleylpyruvate isomerase family mycothiol-dependent enzyme [Umezawaea sp. Da 62-37]WNV82019.1 maleylpyruvate isomerase family mycothiol-dependent enzyme [Umezawaea sp. Da 62-37]
MTIDHHEVLASYSRRFTEAVSGPGALDAEVPSCPGWTVGDLVEHLADVQSWWELVLRAGGPMPDEDLARVAAKTGPDRVGGWRGINARYLEAQRTTPDDTPTWTWWNAERLTTAGVVAWRQAHEAVVHGWDAENAVGVPGPIEPEVAADGVEEFLTHFLHGPEWTRPPLALELRATDVDRVWAVATEGRQPHVVHAGAVGNVINGTAEELYLALWRRGEPTVAVGDAQASAFLSWTDLS